MGKFKGGGMIAFHTRTVAPDVLIVGAGVAGSLLAMGLKNQGLKVLLIDRAAQARPAFKGEYLQPAVVEFIHQMGHYQVFENAPSSRAIKSLRFRDLTARQQVLAELEMTYPEGYEGRSISHFDLISGLNNRAREVLGAQNFWQGVNLSPDTDRSAGSSEAFFEQPQFRCQYQGDSIQITPRWVVGCDGRMSTIRKLMGGPAPSLNGPVVLGTNPEFIYGAEIPEPAPEASRYEVVRSYGNGTLSAFSLGCHGQRLYYSSPEPHKSDTFPRPDQARALIHDLSVNGHLQLGPIDPPQLRLQGFAANTEWYGPVHRGKFILAGDALSVTTPYGGQGMTAAMENVSYLVRHFNWLSLSKSEAALHKALYTQRARATHERINLLNFGLYYTFFARSPVFKPLTHRLINAWERDRDLKARVVRLFGGIETSKPDIFDILALPIPGRQVLQLAPHLVKKRLRWA